MSLALSRVLYESFCPLSGLPMDHVVKLDWYCSTQQSAAGYATERGHQTRLAPAVWSWESNLVHAHEC